MKNYQRPDAEFVVLTTAEEIANSSEIVGGQPGVAPNPFGPQPGTSPVLADFSL